MPNEKLTEIAVILDRSGSMTTIQKDMVGGFAAFVSEQKKLPDPCVLSLYQFDNEFEVVFEEKPLSEVGELPLVPRGSTALLDACGRAITMIGERFAKKPEEQRPGSVIVLVITDGAENASREYQRPQVAEKIKHQQDKYNWQFVFLGANIDAFAEAASLGINSNAVRSYKANGMGVNSMYSATSAAVRNYRSRRSVGDTNATVSFDEEEESKQP